MKHLLFYFRFFLGLSICLFILSLVGLFYSHSIEVFLQILFSSCAMFCAAILLKYFYL